jgi:hypothetical protein
MRPTFTDKLIGELRERLIAHNERAREAGAPLVKLSQLKDVYGRNFRRKNPEVRAMQKVEGYLDDLAKAGNFDETKHPRKRGEFTTKLEASAEAHRRRQQTDAGYRALTTQIIPEHRNELEGSLVRDIGLPLLGVAPSPPSIGTAPRASYPCWPGVLAASPGGSRWAFRLASRAALRASRRSSRSPRNNPASSPRALSNGERRGRQDGKVPRRSRVRHLKGHRRSVLLVRPQTHDARRRPRSAWAA